MNVISQSKNCNNKWSNIVLLDLKSKTFSLFLCENHAINLEHELLPKWLKTSEKLGKNKKLKKEIKIQDSKEILKNIQNEVEQQQEKINSKIKKWIKRNFYKITTIIALIFACIALGFACKDGRQKLSFYLKPDHTAVFGGTIWEHRYDKSTVSFYFANNKKDKTDIKWDGKYPTGYFWWD
ncbi:hypothetical protein [Spiroplasma endosymbiont of Colias croceus]|uniref:hypothetical protein n=1 Tax=Spiroplasma endosymbiont of Colias croceus TaxID=3066310 RepID=UPI0030CAA58E